MGAFKTARLGLKLARRVRKEIVNSRAAQAATVYDALQEAARQAPELWDNFSDEAQDAASYVTKAARARLEAAREQLGSVDFGSVGLGSVGINADSLGAAVHQAKGRVSEAATQAATQVAAKLPEPVRETVESHLPQPKKRRCGCVRKLGKFTLVASLLAALAAVALVVYRQLLGSEKPPLEVPRVEEHSGSAAEAASAKVVYSTQTGDVPATEADSEAEEATAEEIAAEADTATEEDAAEKVTAEEATAEEIAAEAEKAEEAAPESEQKPAQKPAGKQNQRKHKRNR